jgi:hypothetical protein
LNTDTLSKEPAKKGSLINNLLLVFFLLLFLGAEGWFAYRLHTLSKQQEQLKTDYSDANNITMGLFSVEEWHDEIAGIMNHQVRHFKFNTRQKKQLQKEVLSLRSSIKLRL